MIKNASSTKVYTPAVDFSSKDGYFVKATSTSIAAVSAVTDVPHGVIISGDISGGQTSVARPNHPGTVGVKCNGTPGTIVHGTKLTMAADGSVKALPAAAGTYFYVAIADEAGAANEIIEARLIEPVAVTVS